MSNRKKYFFILLFSLGFIAPISGQSKVFPGNEWVTKSASELNIDQEKESQD